MLTKEQAQAEVEKHGSISLAAKANKVPRSTFRRWLRGVKRFTPAASKPGKSLTEFRQAYDKSLIVPQRIREGLKALGEGWEYESQFARLAGLSLPDLGNFRDQFSDHIVVLRRDGKRAWAGTAALAARMREMIK